MKDYSTLKKTILNLLDEAIEAEKNRRISTGLRNGIEEDMLEALGFSKERIGRVRMDMLGAHLTEEEYDPAEDYDPIATLFFISGYVRGLASSYHEYKRAEERAEIIKNVADYNRISYDYAEKIIDGIPVCCYNPQEDGTITCPIDPLDDEYIVDDDEEENPFKNTELI